MWKERKLIFCSKEKESVPLEDRKKAWFSRKQSNKFVLKGREEGYSSLDDKHKDCSMSNKNKISSVTKKESFPCSFLPKEESSWRQKRKSISLITKFKWFVFQEEGYSCLENKHREFLPFAPKRKISIFLAEKKERFSILGKTR